MEIETPLSDHMLEVWQKFVAILAERSVAFQKIMIHNRRMSAQRIRKRQMQLRLQYIQRLADIQNQFLMQIPRPVQKRVWREVRDSDFWDVQVQKEFTNKEWLETFRMSKITFKRLCEKLKYDLTPKCSHVRKPISLEKRVAMSLYKLASGAEYRIVSELFGVARSTVCRFVRMFCEVLTNKHLDREITMPTKREALEIVQGFESLSNLPLVLGVVGTTHIPINPPSEGFENYINAGGWPSIILQGLVDHKFIFHRIELNSRDPALFVDSCAELPKVERTIDEQTIKGYLVGNTSYPLLGWMVKKYPNPSDDSEDFLNSCIEEVNSIADDAFSRLFARWRVISKKTDIEYRNMANVISACCILNNMIEKNKDGFNYDWVNQLKPSYRDLQPEEDAQSSLPDTPEGLRLREYLKEFLKVCCE